MRLLLRRSFLWNVVWVAPVIFLVGTSSAEQSNGPQPSFEVASVKPNVSGSSSYRTSISHTGRFVGTNLTVKALIQLAYRVQQYQIIGGPHWLATDHYDIEAKVDVKVTPEQIADMVRSLLADRFMLKLHHDIRELPIYALVIVKSGSKLTANTSGSDNHSSSTLRGKMRARNVPIETLVTLLSSQLDRVVVDRTGLTGNFDWQLEWSPEASRAGIPPETTATADSTGPSIFTAIQEQLGLRLEGTKAPANALTIDAVERPSEN
jgi:uncharacterized protein (TIGR03435 family)